MEFLPVFRIRADKFLDFGHFLLGKISLEDDMALLFHELRHLRLIDLKELHEFAFDDGAFLLRNHLRNKVRDLNLCALCKRIPVAIQNVSARRSHRHDVSGIGNGFPFIGRIHDL